jgi:hypothetical protein
MDYAQKDLSSEENISEVREPVAVYGISGRPAVKEPWGNDDTDDEFDSLYDDPATAPDGGNWVDWHLAHDPEFAADFERRMEEAELAIKEGRVHTQEDVKRLFKQRFENGYYR